MKNVDRKHMWRCAISFDHSTGKFDVNERCIDILGQKLYWGFEGGDECDQYWGGEKPGLLNRLIPEEYDEYGECMNTRMTKVGTKMMRATEEERVSIVLKTEKKCVPEDLCKFHTGLFGYCSTFYDTTVKKSCPEDNGHREQFCTTICPPAGGMLQDDPDASNVKHATDAQDDVEEKEEEEEEEEVEEATFPQSDKSMPTTACTLAKKHTSTPNCEQGPLMDEAKRHSVNV